MGTELCQWDIVGAWDSHAAELVAAAFGAAIGLVGEPRGSVDAVAHTRSLVGPEDSYPISPARAVDTAEVRAGELGWKARLERSGDTEV